MGKSFSLILRDPALRVAVFTVFCVGFTFAATIPYMSLVAIEQLGFTPKAYATLQAANAFMGMIGAVVLGYFSDRSTNRKRGVMLSCCVGLAGFLLFYMLPNAWTLTIVFLLFMPVSGAAYTQLFAIIRAIANDRAPYEAVSINATARSIYALSWIVVPGLIGTWIAMTGNVSDSFAAGAIAFLICIVCYGLFGTAGNNPENRGASAWSGLREAAQLIANRAIALPILAMGMISCIHSATATLLPLLITQLPEGNTSHIGAIAGLTAGLEIPFMLLGGLLGRRIALWKIVFAAALVHVVFMLLTGQATAVSHMYVLAFLNAIGNAILLTLHLTYMQDLMPDRPGLGSSLLSISVLINKLLAATIFAAAASWLGYSGATLATSLVALAGAVLLFLLHFRSAEHVN